MVKKTPDKLAKKAPKNVAEKAPKKPAEKAGAKDGPPFVQHGGKVIGARALANLAGRLRAATTREEWFEATRKIPPPEYEAPRVLAHLLEHGFFAPTCRLQASRCAEPLGLVPPAAALRVLSGLDEGLVEMTREVPVVTLYVPVIARLQRLAPGALREAPLPPTLARVAALVRAIAGEELREGEGFLALTAVSQLLPYGPQTIATEEVDGRPVMTPPDALRAALERAGGPRWFDMLSSPESVPAELLGPALAAEPLEELGRFLCHSNKAMLDARPEPPARFVEAADKLPDHKQPLLFIAAIGHASTPDEIPAKIEHYVTPPEALGERGFARLGTARLDRWAEGWMARFPHALESRDPMDPATSIGTALARLAAAGLPFGEAMRQRLLAAGDR